VTGRGAAEVWVKASTQLSQQKLMHRIVWALVLIPRHALRVQEMKGSLLPFVYNFILQVLCISIVWKLQ
jgi:hypothetical protein